MQDAPYTLFADTLAREQPTDASGVCRVYTAGLQVTGTAIHVNPETDEEWLETEIDGSPAFVSMTALLRVHPDNLQDGDLAIGREVVDRWWGVPIEYEPGDLEPIPPNWTIPDGKDYRLRREALAAVLKMLEAAANDDVDMRIISAYRPGIRQRALYLAACDRDGNGQRYSARPGHSEHQLGTTVDLTDPDQRYNFEHAFQDTPQGQWLAANAASFGFRRSYTDDNTAETGYISEPWHWRYHGRQHPNG